MQEKIHPYIVINYTTPDPTLSCDFPSFRGGLHLELENYVVQPSRTHPQYSTSLIYRHVIHFHYAIHPKSYNRGILESSHITITLNRVPSMPLLKIPPTYEACRGCILLMKLPECHRRWLNAEPWPMSR